MPDSLSSPGDDDDDDDECGLFIISRHQVWSYLRLEFDDEQRDPHHSEDGEADALETSHITIDITIHTTIHITIITIILIIIINHLVHLIITLLPIIIITIRRQLDFKITSRCFIFRRFLAPAPVS